MISYQILQGDCYGVLKNLSANPQELGKYRLIVTSPPYYKHRHYGKDTKEIGLMKSLLKNYLTFLRYAGIS